MTDGQIIHGILEKKESAFREFVEKYRPNVMRPCHSLVHSLDDAEDLTQETFIEVYHSIGRFRGKAALSTWIYRIAVNKSLNHIRKNKKESLVSRIGSFFGKDEPGIPVTENTALEEKEKMKILYGAVDSLSRNQRIAFTLHKYDELSYKEIAEVMNVSVSSVESLIHRAKRNLQKKLRGYYSK
jgi:RNA polymerase sigma-70 factor (ECF subfamily)